LGQGPQTSASPPDRTYIPEDPTSADQAARQICAEEEAALHLADSALRVLVFDMVTDGQATLYRWIHQRIWQANQLVVRSQFLE
jgi:hypothetical protein